jgi:dolichol-phosphate mannosyltransferase
MTQPIIYICFAAFNEEQDLPGLLERIQKLPPQGYRYQIIAYNDGSTDGTQQLLERFALVFPVAIIGDSRNHGLGYGINRLIDTLCETSSNNSDVAVFCDADNSHDPETISLMLQKIAQGSDVVIASRFQAGSSVYGFPQYRALLSRAASWYFRMLLPIKGVKDYTSGYRAYRVAALKNAKQKYGGQLIHETGFSCQVELLSKLAPSAKIDEVAMTYYYDRKLGRSKLRLLSTIFRTLMVGTRIALMQKS